MLGNINRLLFTLDTQNIFPLESYQKETFIFKKRKNYTIKYWKEKHQYFFPLVSLQYFFFSPYQYISCDQKHHPSPLLTFTVGVHSLISHPSSRTITRGYLLEPLINGKYQKSNCNFNEQRNSTINYHLQRVSTVIYF